MAVMASPNGDSDHDRGEKDRRLLEARRRAARRPLKPRNMEKNATTRSPAEMDADTMALIAPTMPQISSSLELKAMKWMQSTGRKHCVYSYIPSVIGQVPCVGFALAAQMEAYGTETKQDCINTSMLAARSLSALMKTQAGATSDEAMLTAALLSLFEGVDRTSGIQWTGSLMHKPRERHMNGLAAMFSSRPPTYATGDLYRALWYATHYYIAFTLQLISTELDSPFEHPGFLHLDPPSDDAGHPYAGSLRKQSNMLFIYLPRLIKLSKRALQSEDEAAQKEAIKVAAALYNLKEPAAEDRLLHSVNVIATPDTDKTGKKLVPWVFKFPDFKAFEAAVVYWTTRLLTLTLCYRLKDVPGAPFDADELTRDALRTVKNITMSWHAMSSHKAITSRRSSMGLQAVFGALSVFPESDKMPIEATQSWIVNRVNDLTECRASVTKADMHEFEALKIGDGIIRSTKILNLG